jgi:phage terminase Nu1 subunit (DNA packaging protein)
MAEVFHRYVRAGDNGKMELDKELVAERKRLLEVRRHETELKLAKARGELISRATVLQQSTHMLALARQYVMSLPQRHARRLAGITDEVEMHRALDLLMREILGTLSDLPRVAAQEAARGAGKVVEETRQPKATTKKKKSPKRTRPA